MENDNISCIIRKFNVTAISIPIVYDFFGDYDPNGMMYILKEDKDEVKKKALKNFNNKDENGLPLPKPTEEVQPLTIRANVGDKIKIEFDHNEDRRLSIHMQGLKYENILSDGTNVGYNENSTVGPGEKIIYEWYADREGIFYFSDMGDARSSEKGTNIHGLFGALIVQAKGSSWTDPIDGNELKSGIFADIHNPFSPSFREYVVYFHDELEMVNRFGEIIIDPNTNQSMVVTAISYRLEPMVNRASFIPRAYKGSPSKFRLIHGGVLETHVFQLHKHQWRLEPDNAKSTIMDLISISPQESYTVDILYEAGSLAPDATITKELKSLQDRKTSLEKDLSVEPCIDKKYKYVCQKADVIFELFLLEAKLVYNKAGWNDPNGRFCVAKEQIERYTGCKVTNENKEKLAKIYVNGVKNRSINVEPLVIRANKGDCIEIRLTNFLPETLLKTNFQLKNLTDNSGFHIHLVKVDVKDSDDSENGYNSSDSVFYGETLVERYYANEELSACFFYDQFNSNSHKQHGVFGALIIEPEGSKYYDPKTAKLLRYGTKAVIKTQSGRIFREFGLFINDFILLFDKEGTPLNQFPSAASNDDSGVVGVNYKCEPLGERLSGKRLNCNDSAYVFSSKVHGDPVTPILETYPGEEIVIRLLYGANEEQHAFNINGMKWRKEIINNKSNLVQSQTIGISEAFNIKIKGDYKPGDYLYYFGGQYDFWLGLWGIIRVYKNRTYKVLPIRNFNNYDNKINSDKIKKVIELFIESIQSFWINLMEIIRGDKDKISKLLPLSNPNNYENKIDNYKDKKVREFHIAAIQKDIIYNDFKDHDPDGLLFVPYEYKDDIISGNMKPTPLILRANKGEYIKVTLTNCFTKEIPYQHFPGVPVDKVVTPSIRIGISAQFLSFDPVTDSGVNIGYNNLEQTVKPGESKNYLWYADEEYGACLLSSFTDIRNHKYHGLFGAIIIEPEGANIVSDNIYGEQATIYEDGNDHFKEFVIFIHNGIRLLDINDNLILSNKQVDKEEVSEQREDTEIGCVQKTVDFEERGEKGLNYRSERFFNRLQPKIDTPQVKPDISEVFSSRVHGDPATPIFEASPGERVIIRLLIIGDKPGNVSFMLHGHELKVQSDERFSNVISVQGAMVGGNVFNIELLNGASMIPGDYLYRASNIRLDIESGMWGIFRIKEN